MRPHSGFTLVELLLVCAILAALSYVSWGAYAGIDRRVGDDLARVELTRLADALKRFHTDTGYWPGEGPFQLAASAGAGSADCDLSDMAAIAPMSVGPYALGTTAPGSGSIAERQRWLASPANMSLLFDAPVLCAGHRLAFLQSWNARTQRGWNGPYLPQDKKHWLDLRSADKLVNIPAFAAGPDFAPNADNPACTPGGDINTCAFHWRRRPLPETIFDMDGDGADDTTGYTAAIHEITRHARPFLFLLNPPRVIYWGADGRYGGNVPPDSNPCQPNTDDPDGRDDHVICL